MSTVQDAALALPTSLGSAHEDGHGATAIVAEIRATGDSSVLGTMRCVFLRELRLASRRRAEVLGSLFFFLLVVCLFPLAVGPDLPVLRVLAPGIVWVAALLACLVALARLFAADHADGTLEQLLLSPEPLFVLVASKALAAWVVSGVPLVLIAPVLALQYDLPTASIGVLTASLLLGTPALFLIGSVGAALTLGLRGGTVLLSLLVLPLEVPVLIFGAGAVDASASAQGAAAQISLLGACLAFALAFCPWVAAAALRIALE